MLTNASAEPPTRERFVTQNVGLVNITLTRQTSGMCTSGSCLVRRFVRLNSNCLRIVIEYNTVLHMLHIGIVFE